LRISRSQKLLSEPIMKEQDQLQARNIDSLGQEELDRLLDVSGWRIWTSSIHSVLDIQYWISLEKVLQNPNALVITPRHRGHDLIEEKLHGVRLPFKMDAFDVPDYVLEPLDQETVAHIEGGDLKRLIKPEDLRALLAA